MKKFVCFIVFMLGFGILGGCSSNNAPKEEVALETILTEITEQIAKDLQENGVEDALVDGKLQGYFASNLLKPEENDPTGGFLLERMELDKENLAEGYLLAHMMNVNSNEIIILKSKDKDHVTSLKASLEKELAAQVQMWEQYLPDQYEKVKNNVIKTNGNYLIYVTYDKPDKIIETFEKHVK